MYRQYRRKISRQIQKLLGKRKASRKRTQAHNALSFSPLEPRQLLAIVATPVPAGTNLVVNGDFETTQNSGPQFAADDVAGWNVDVNLLEEEIINIYNTSRAGNLLELDSKSNVEDRVYQDIPTNSGDQYVLAFDIRDRFNSESNGNAATNFVDVFWGGVSQGTFAADTMWQTIALEVTGDSSGTTRLEFREIGSGNDGVGPLIDNVRVIAVTDSELGNGSFENITETTNRFVSAENVDSWRAGGDVASRRLNIVNDGNATDGSRYLNIETTDSHVDRIFQDVSTTAGANYYLMFDMRGDADSDSNELRIRWNDRWAGSFEGGSEWQSFGILLNATSDTSRLVFREASSGSGPFIDNVRIVEVTQPTDVTNDFIVGLTTAVSTTFTENGSPLSPLSNINLEHASNNRLTAARFKLASVPDGADESLSVDVGNSGLTSFYDAADGRLVINGTASLSVYMEVMETLTYDNVSNDPTTGGRSISAQIFDSAVTGGNQFSQRQFFDITIASVNDAPTIEAIPVQNVAFGASLQYETVASDAEGGDVTYSISTTGNVGSDEVTINDDGVINWTNFAQEGNIDVTVEVTDSGGATASTDFRIFAGGFTPFSGNGDLSGIDPAARNGIYSAAPEMTIDTSKDYEAILKTDDGDIRLTLNDDLAPITVNNFVNLAQDGFYDGLTFHRVIGNFVAQGGDPLGTGSGGPGYNFQDEFVDSLRFTGKGQLAMANSGPATNGSQFFITYAAQSHLNDAHTIFGQLTGDESAFDAIVTTAPGASPTVINSVEIVVT